MIFYLIPVLEIFISPKKIKTKKLNRKISKTVILKFHYSQKLCINIFTFNINKFLQSSCMNSEVYQTVVLSNMVAEKKYIDPNYIFQQDGAYKHTSRSTENYLRENCADFIKPKNWDPNSRNLNPVDYTMYGILENTVYLNANFSTIEKLKNRIVVGKNFLKQ